MTIPLRAWLPDRDPDPVNPACEAVRGILRCRRHETFVESADGARHFADEVIWRGYREHFANQPVVGRRLPQADYDTGRPICILWPDEPPPGEPHVELYYNERLVKYAASLLGHNAINVDGRIYNYSHRLDENEVLTHEEYFYRPALGEFAPSPRSGRNETVDGRRYLDKFGRRFMRTIHALRVFGIDTPRLARLLDATMRRIHDAPPGGPSGDKWREFNPLTRNCTTLLRDALNEYGFAGVKGQFPRELFVSAAYHLSRRPELCVEIVTVSQLKVAEAPYSAPAPLLNPLNHWRRGKLPAPA